MLTTELTTAISCEKTAPQMNDKCMFVCISCSERTDSFIASFETLNKIMQHCTHCRWVTWHQGGSQLQKSGRGLKIILYMQNMGGGGKAPSRSWQINLHYLNQEADYAHYPSHYYLPSPSDFQTFLRPCSFDLWFFCQIWQIKWKIPSNVTIIQFM